MRTTIEIRPEHLARIRKLAATRGEKGISNIIAEALETYLEAQAGRTRAMETALAVKGLLSAEDAGALRAQARKIRANW